MVAQINIPGVDIRTLTPAQADGTACVICHADFLKVRVTSVPVGRSETGSQVFACKPCLPAASDAPAPAPAVLVVAGDDMEDARGVALDVVDVLGVHSVLVADSHGVTVTDFAAVVMVDGDPTHRPDADPNEVLLWTEAWLEGVPIIARPSGAPVGCTLCGAEGTMPTRTSDGYEPLCRPCSRTARRESRRAATAAV